MTNAAESIEGPDPQTTQAQAAALAAHLERIGIQWLPTPNAASVETLESQFARDSQPEPSAQTEAKVTARVDASTSPNPPTSATKAPAASASNFSLLGETEAAGAYPGSSLDPEARKATLADYEQRVSTCTRCELLSKCRTKTVFGEGSVNPRVVFFGEGPGRDEDLSGRPFVGKAGQLLTKMIKACTFEREDVYIMNTIKCRPPNNRNPEPTEIENCREFFEAQLATLRPEYIVCLGLVSAQALLRTKLSVGRMRGKFHSYFDSKVVVTYHPAYLLRTPAAKKAAWEDLQMMLRDAGLIE